MSIKTLKWVGITSEPGYQPGFLYVETVKRGKGKRRKSSRGVGGKGVWGKGETHPFAFVIPGEDPESSLVLCRAFCLLKR